MGDLYLMVNFFVGYICKDLITGKDQKFYCTWLTLEN